MAKANIIDVLLKTIGDVQQTNRKNPNVETADANVFDLLRDKLKNLDDKTRNKRAAKGKSPDSILDLIRKEVEGARKQNKKDPNVKTAPKSIFKDILKKVEAQPKKQAAKSIINIIREYNLNTKNIPNKYLNKVQEKYIADRKKLDQQYAQGIHDLAKKFN